MRAISLMAVVCLLSACGVGEGAGECCVEETSQAAETCPSTPLAGCPDPGEPPDTDGDGVADELDACPLEPGDGADGCPPCPTAPLGIYDGPITITATSNDDATCEKTPPGFTIPLRISLRENGAVYERENVCVVTDRNPSNFTFACANHDYHSICDTDPNDGVDGCAKYNQTRSFVLRFDNSCKRAVGTLSDMSNWGCTVRHWNVAFDLRPLPLP
jgi:hypothetical protein